MTREDALEVFSTVKERSEHFKECGCRFPLWTITERDEEAIDMAIEALSNYKLKGKDADIVVIDASGRQKGSIVQCKDCRNTIIRPDGEIYCKHFDREEMPQYGYCNWGERKGGDDE